MEKKINIAELLKDCPKGMELDCINYDGIVIFEGIIDCPNYPIKISVKYDNEYFTETLTKYGQTCRTPYNKCVIFPKGKTTWEGFQRPFKDGDVLSYQFSGFENRSIYIYMYHPRMNTTYYVAVSGDTDSEFMINDKEGHALNGYNDTVRFSTAEEKQKLFDAIKDHGYKWNADTKTLENLIEPKFKVGDKVVFRDAKDKPLTIRKIWWDCQARKILCSFEEDDIDVPVEDLDRYIKPKFNINTLKPFESRVLVRDSVKEPWKPDFFGCLCGSNNYPYMVVGGIMWKCCIPYKNNEHLLWTTDDCNDFYKTWE